MSKRTSVSGRPAIAAAFIATTALLLIPGSGLSQNAPPRPCEGGGDYDAFDFWVGEWDVFTPDGKKAGTNRIEETEGGCILLESWTGAGGGTGTSINYFDPAANEWNQLWVSPNGVVIRIAGGLREGSMVLAGELIGPKGKSQPFRGTWTPNSDGSVRQFFEISADDGATWTAWFDGKYVRAGQGND